MRALPEKRARRLAREYVNFMNLEDIARKAGVSRSTVSRVINNEPYVREQTRQKVLEIIERERFSPNPAARALVTQRTRVIGVVIPSTINVVFEDSFYFPTLLQGVADATHARDYAMLLWLGKDGEDQERFQNRVTKNRLMDGLIIASATLNDPFVERLVQSDLRFVMVERPSNYHDRVSYVTVDNVSAAQVAVEHLINHGRRKIATITGALDNPDGQDRLEGYKKALKRSGIPFNPALVAEGRFTRKAGYLGMRQLLDQDIDAVFAASDLTAMGALDALRETDLRVPEDLALVGFDDLPYASESTPQLTTVRHPIQDKGARATMLLLDLIEGALGRPQQVLLPTQLVIRQSCGAIRY